MPSPTPRPRGAPRARGAGLPRRGRPAADRGRGARRSRRRAGLHHGHDDAHPAAGQGRAHPRAVRAAPTSTPSRGTRRSVEASLAAHRMRRVLDAGGDRAGVLARFVADLSPEDEQLLGRAARPPTPTTGPGPDMDVVMCVPAVVSAGLWLRRRRLARRLPPATAVRLLTLAALLTALSTGFVLAVAAFLVLARLPVVAVARPLVAPPRWRRLDPVPAAGRRRGRRRRPGPARRGGAADRRAPVATWPSPPRTCRRLGPDAGGLVVVDDARPEAYAAARVAAGGWSCRPRCCAPCRPTSGARCWPTRRRTCAHHHHLYVAARRARPPRPTRCCARWRPRVRVGVERWADEVAAAEVGTGAWWPGRWPAPASPAPRPRAGRSASLSRRSGAVDSAVAERTRALLGAATAPRACGGWRPPWSR